MMRDSFISNDVRLLIGYKNKALLSLHATMSMLIALSISDDVHNIKHEAHIFASHQKALVRRCEKFHEHAHDKCEQKG